MVFNVLLRSIVYAINSMHVQLSMQLATAGRRAHAPTRLAVYIAASYDQQNRTCCLAPFPHCHQTSQRVHVHAFGIFFRHDWHITPDSPTAECPNTSENLHSYLCDGLKERSETVPQMQHLLRGILSGRGSPTQHAIRSLLLQQRRTLPLLTPPPDTQSVTA